MAERKKKLLNRHVLSDDELDVVSVNCFIVIGQKFILNYFSLKHKF